MKKVMPLALLLILTAVLIYPEAVRSENDSTDCGKTDPWIIDAIKKGKCPKWVPDSKCKGFINLSKDSIELSYILCEGWKIVKAKYENGKLVIVTKKHSLRQRIEIGEFDNIKNVKFVGNKLLVTYTKGKLSVREKSIWGAGGFSAGVLSTLLIVLLFML